MYNMNKRRQKQDKAKPATNNAKPTIVIALFIAFLIIEASNLTDML